MRRQSSKCFLFSFLFLPLSFYSVSLSASSHVTPRSTINRVREKREKKSVRVSRSSKPIDKHSCISQTSTRKSFFARLFAFSKDRCFSKWSCDFETRCLMVVREIEARRGIFFYDILKVYSLIAFSKIGFFGKVNYQ